MATAKKVKEHAPTKKSLVNYRHENLWSYLKTKIFINGVKDNNKLAKQIFNYVDNHFTAKK